ncbi:MAG: PAS domain-containing sensor histidine kinase [Chitinophagaceae bacterium]
MKGGKARRKNAMQPVKTASLDTAYASKYLRLLNSAKLLKDKKDTLEQALEEIEDIYNNAPCGYHSLDVKGVFLRINDTELRWLKMPRAGFAGVKKFTDILTEESKIKFSKTYPLFMKNGQIQDEEFDFVRSDGTSFPVLLSATAIYDAKGHYKMSRSVVVDISARKQMEQQLRSSYEDLQQKNDALTIANENLFFMNREKSQFMDIATHDLQLPLVAITMLSETLLKKNIPSGSEEERQIFEMIQDASMEMKTLLTNYLSASQSDAGNMSLFMQELDINVLTNEIVQRYIPIAQKKNIAIHFKNNKNFLLFTDRECCAQIIENLVSNAVKYTPFGKNVTVAVTGNNKEVKIIVADEGPGIKKEDRHLLFQRFQKLSARPTGGELSTGLGLSIVKYLVEQLKGSITVESEIDKGSTFTVHLPIGGIE